MMPTAAAWVLETVLPRQVVDGAGALLSVCACQYGLSTRCATGSHDGCAHRTQSAWYDRPTPETYLTGRAGGALAEVWLTGTDHRWRCSCTCHAPDGAATRGLLFDL